MLHSLLRTLGNQPLLYHGDVGFSHMGSSGSGRKACLNARSLRNFEGDSNSSQVQIVRHYEGQIPVSSTEIASNAASICVYLCRHLAHAVSSGWRLGGARSKDWMRIFESWFRCRSHDGCGSLRRQKKTTWRRRRSSSCTSVSDGDCVEMNEWRVGGAARWKLTFIFVYCRWQLTKINYENLRGGQAYVPSYIRCP